MSKRAKRARALALREAALAVVGRTGVWESASELVGERRSPAHCGAPRTRSHDCSGRTRSPPLTSAPRTPGGKATSALRSSTCSEARLGPHHPPGFNRAPALGAMEGDLF